MDTAPETSDTFAWLLTAVDPCPACGARAAPEARACGACGRDLTEVYRPPGRSAAVVALAALWGLAAAAGLLMAAGGALQGRAPAPQPAADGGGQIWRSLARVLGVAALDAPVAAAPPPAWLLPALLAAALLAGAMAWLCWSRRPAALYAGLAAAAAAALGGVGAGVLAARGAGAAAGAALALGGVAAGGALALAYLGAARELLGERRRRRVEDGATSGPALFQAGRAWYEQGLTFAAARAWARAVGRDPGNADYRRALGLALERLGRQRGGRGAGR